MEVVYVTFDRDEEEFNEYFQTMPFLAIPWAEIQRREKIEEKFKIEGFPQLIVLDKNANVLSKDARNDVTENVEESIIKWRLIMANFKKLQEVRNSRNEVAEND